MGNIYPTTQRNIAKDFNVQQNHMRTSNFAVFTGLQEVKSLSCEGYYITICPQLLTTGKTSKHSARNTDALEP
jgi:hypothetical protein